MADNDWKARLGMVYSTNPDFQYDTGTAQGPVTLPPAQQDLRVWLDRKQRGGKVVTLVRGFVGCDADLQELARLLKTRCGVGGTARAALKIANDWYEKPAGNRILTPAEVRRLTKLLLKRDHQTRKLILRHCPDRVHTILPGIVLMDALTEALCEGELYISPYGVREGYLCHKLLNAGT